MNLFQVLSQLPQKFHYSSVTDQSAVLIHFHLDVTSRLSTGVEEGLILVPEAS